MNLIRLLSNSWLDDYLTIRRTVILPFPKGMVKRSEAIKLNHPSQIICILCRLSLPFFTFRSA